jgi:hypothetical protein
MQEIQRGKAILLDCPMTDRVDKLSEKKNEEQSASHQSRYVRVAGGLRP